MIKLPPEHIENMKPEDLKLHGVAHEQDDMIEHERSKRGKQKNMEPA